MRRKRRRNMGSCYWCGRPATSLEHAPPDCFYPKGAARDPRVPSCAAHNQDKKLEDEYLRAVVTAHEEVNSVGQTIFRTRVLNKIRRRPHTASTFYSGLSPVQINGQITGMFEVDRSRFDYMTEAIARAVYYRHFDAPAPQEILITSSSFYLVGHPHSSKVNSALSLYEGGVKAIFANAERHGSCPDVFYYQVIRSDERPEIVLRLVFYEGAAADVLFGYQETASVLLRDAPWRSLG